MSRRLSLITAALIGLCVLVLLSLPVPVLNAQDSPFATNTPRSPENQVTATLDPASAPRTPEAPFERYALRLWTQNDILNTLETYVGGLTSSADADAAQAIDLLQHEISVRFPNAPSDAAVRDRLLDAILNAPRGSVDARRYAIGYIEDALNAEQPAFDATTSFERENFFYELRAININNSGALDALVHVRYPAAAAITNEPQFEMFLIAEPDDVGSWRILPSNPLLPAAPFGELARVELAFVGDLTGDSTDEIALSLDTGSLNRTLRVYGWRAGQLTDLVQPNQNILFGAISTLTSGSPIGVQEYNTLSERWGCVGQQQVNWSWVSNYFRPAPAIGGFQALPTLGCSLHQLEPIFSSSPTTVRSTLDILLMSAEANDPALPRARVLAAMMTVLTGDIPSGVLEMEAVRSTYANDTWVQAQAGAFLSAASQPNATPLRLCAALANAAPSPGQGACDVNDVLARILTEQPLTRDLTIESQLEGLGARIINSYSVAEVGRLPRQVYQLRVGGANTTDYWWAFAALQPDVYTAEPAQPPEGYTQPSTAPSVIEPPAAAISGLRGGVNLANVITLLDTAVRDGQRANELALPSPALLYLRALAYDLLNDRQNARSAYFDLWVSAPDTVWGQLAADHLERR